MTTSAEQEASPGALPALSTLLRREAAPLGLVLVLSLGLAALRIDLIRIRYGVADVLAEEESLLEEQRELIVRQRQLRDPARLTERAKALGFEKPETVVTLTRVTNGAHQNHKENNRADGNNKSAFHQAAPAFFLDLK